MNKKELKFKENKDINQSLYNLIKNKDIEKIISPLIKEFQIKKVWEPGAGLGYWTKFFLDKRLDLVASDINRVVLEENQKRNPEARFILESASESEFKNNEKFDLIFAKDIIEHIKDDKKLISNFNKHLKEKGFLFITTQNSFSLNYFLEKFYYFLKGNKNWFGWDKSHLRFYNFLKLNRILKNNNFKIINYFGYYYFPYRAITKLFTGEIKEKKFFHLIENYKLNRKFPFNITGWNIGLIAQKGRDKFK